MIIGIDGNEANVSMRVGISEYAYWLLYYFAKFATEKKESQVKFTVYLKNKPFQSLPSQEERWQYNVFGPKKLWSQLALPFHLFVDKPRPDVFFSPGHYTPRFSSIPTVVSVMDISYLYFPDMFKKTDLFQLRRWTGYSVRKASRVLTISDSSKDDIIREYKIPANKVITIHPGVKETVSLEPHVYGMNQLKTKYNLSDNYLLFVGTLQPRKNIVRLIEAFSKVILERSDRIPSRSKRDPIGLKPSRMTEKLQLVIVGKKGWLYEDILKAPKQFGIENHVKFLDDVGDDELPIFYKNAVCFVLPSLYEGFGLPVLEAMKYGCPVITSNISSLPEAGGDAALYVDPEDVDDIAGKIKELLHNEKLRHTLSEKGKKQAAKFSWEKTARETLDILKQVAQKSS